MSPSTADAPPRQHATAQQGAGRLPLSSVNPTLASLPQTGRQRSEDSWIEVSSQPSTSSLSSAGDEIITEGLRVQHDSNLRRRRRSRPGTSMQQTYQTTSTGASSQEEYEESESESDRAMMSSFERPRASPLQYELRNYSTTSSEEISAGEDDDDENSTAVNYPRGNSNPVFRPQPNAFTHPTSQPRLQQRTGSYTGSRPNMRTSTQRHSYSGQQRHSPYNVVSPSHQADHDAVLRASLSTLLSLGAAARGLPKSSQYTHNPSATPSSRVEPSSLRLVPESVALGNSPLPSEPLSSIPSRPVSSTSEASFSPLTTDKSKRKITASSTPRSRSRERALSKKAKRTTSAGNAMDDVSPTMFTWAVSAGIIVLFSAVSFSAGYMVGKETGRAEVIGHLGSGAGEAGSCAREVAGEMGRSGLGLKKLRWSGVTSAAAGVRV